VRARLSLAVLGAAVIVGTAVSATAQTAEVTMPAKLFAPRDLDVLVGTTVMWRNADQTTHTVSEDEDEFDSGFVRPGGSFSQRFSEQGTFVYHCTIHRFMQGAVHVFQVVLNGPDDPVPAGKRTRLDGVAPPGAGEVVLERVSPRPVEVVGRATPGLEGAFSFGVRVPEPRSYRVRAGSASSPVVRVSVTPHVSIAIRGAMIAVYARPTRAGSRVAIQMYERERFAFVTVARGRLDASSRAAIRYVPERRAHVRAVVRGSQGWSDGFSRPRVVLPR
jgi:plastocyanin